ncbi:MAG: hypothetical protein J6C09_05130 [Clostridia bacterium]|nr:hypothetical protein [Clostridia bacterium]
MIAKYGDMLRASLGEVTEDFLSALSELYSLYTEDLPLWLGSMYDKEFGGFYYSASARDTEGFLPDPDSTYQALRILQYSGMTGDVGCGYGKLLPEKMKNKIIRFLKSTQAENGYFYHPAMERELLDTRKTVRRSRDTQRATAVLCELGSLPTYDTPFGVRGDGILASGEGVRIHSGVTTCEPCRAGNARVALPFLESPEAFREYLSTLTLIDNSYSTGSHFNSQFYELASRDKEIREAGKNYSFVEELISWLTENQLDNGLWNRRADYAAVNGLMKISGIYRNAGRVMPKSEEALISAVDAILSDEEPDAVTSVFNPWTAVYRILAALRKGGEEEYAIADRARAKLLGLCPEAIRKTKEKLSVFRKPDGGFSYTPRFSAHVSSGAPAAVKETAESDVNATLLATTDTVSAVFSALELDDRAIPIYSPKDFKIFLRKTEEI